MDKRKSKFPSVDPLYLRHLRWLLTGVIALMLCLSLTLFFTFERMAHKIVFNDAITLLGQTAESTANLMDTCVQITFQIQKDTVISPILYYSSATPGQDAVALSQLSRYQYIIKSLDSIYVYNCRTKKIYSSCSLYGLDNYIMDDVSFPDQSALELVRNYQDYPAYRAIPRQASYGNCYTLIGYDFTHKDDSDSLNSAVLVNISADWLKTLIASNDPENTSGETLIINTDGRVISDTEKFPMTAELSSILPEARGIVGQKKNGYLLTGNGNERQFIAYTAPDDMGWQYIRIIPYSTIISGISRIRWLTVAILFGFLFVGLLVS